MSVRNTNDQFTWSHGFQKVYQAENQIKFGRVINVQRRNHLGLSYDVQLFDSASLTVEGCKLLSTEAGFNGTGTANPINEGTPVVVAFKNGVLQDGIIIGCFNTEGNYQEFYGEGNLQEPGQTLEGADYNQPLGHPNRITQEDSYFKVTAGKTISSQYDSPEFHSIQADKAKSYPMPSSIEMRNQGGDAVVYTMGANIIYSDGNVISVSSGDREEKSSKLLRFSAMHARRAELLSGVSKEIVSGKDAAKHTSSTGVISIVSSKNRQTQEEAIPDSYRVEQEKKLADLYAQAAKAQNQLTAARQTEANNLQQEFGTELATSAPNRTQVQPDYKPSETKSRVDKNNYGDRAATDINGATLSNELLVVLHETVSSADSALNHFSNPSAEASYHAIVKRDGSIIYLVDPSQRAFGAANSTFNGESVKLSATANASVNNFAYHVSLESPEDGRGNTSTHSGYTSQQYQSLAWLISKTGAPDSRITTHAEVDRTGERSDPRSFDRATLSRLLRAYPRTRELEFGPGVR